MAVNVFWKSDHPDEARLRVLCVDDNRDLADSYCELLQLSGYEAIACYDGITAVRLARTFRPDLCIVDLNMPGLQGDDVARAILTQSEGPLPILIAITAMSGDRDRLRTHVAGFRTHLVKPVDPRELLRLLESYRIRLKRSRGETLMCV